MEDEGLKNCKKIIFYVISVVLCCIITSTLFPMQRSGFATYVNHFGDQALYQVGYEGDLDVLIELLMQPELESQSSIFDHIRVGVDAKKNSFLLQLIERYQRGLINKETFIAQLSELRDSHYYKYNLAYHQNAAYFIGYAGDIPALIELVQKYNNDCIFQAQLGLEASNYDKLGSLVRQLIENKFDKEKLIQRLEQLNDSSFYYYELRYGKRATEMIAFYKDIHGLIELVEKYADDPDSFIFSNISFELHRAENTELFSLFRQFTKKELSKSQLIEKLNELLDREYLESGSDSDGLSDLEDSMDTSFSGYESSDN